MRQLTFENKYKALSEEDLADIFQDIQFNPTPRKHQYQSMAFAAGEGLHRVLYLHGVGTGKTLTSLFTIKMWNTIRTNGPCERVLVVCPPSAVSAWHKGLKLCGQFTYTFLTKLGDKQLSREERLENLSSDANIYVINYEGLKCLFGELKTTTVEINNPDQDLDSPVLKEKKKWVINYELIGDLFDCVVIDEIHHCGDYKSLQSDTLFHISQRARYCIGLTGTLVNKDLLPIWSIYRVVDLGATFGTNFFIYKNAHFKQINKWYWVPKHGKVDYIMKKMSNIAISFERSECRDLPKHEEITIEVEKTKQHELLEHKLITDSKIMLDGKVVESKADAVGIKLKELCGGFIYTDKDHNVYTLPSNPKLDALHEIIEETDEKIIVFHQFNEEGKILEDWCNKHKIKYASIRGETDKKTNENRFKNNKDVQLLIAQARCISEGCDDLTCATIVVFYSINSNARERTQCKGRVDRDGQTKPTMSINLVIKNSIDEKVLNSLDSNRSFVQQVVEYLKDRH